MCYSIKLNIKYFEIDILCVIYKIMKLYNEIIYDIKSILFILFFIFIFGERNLDRIRITNK